MPSRQPPVSPQETPPTRRRQPVVPDPDAIVARLAGVDLHAARRHLASQQPGRGPGVRVHLARVPLPVLLVAITALAMLVPAAHAAIMDHHAVSRAFFQSALGLMTLAIMVGLAWAPSPMRNPERVALGMLALAYLLLPLAQALPLIAHLADTTALNAWFDMISAFTTTGASVYDPGRLSPSLHLWRAMVGWMGGGFILVAAAAVLAPLNLGGAEVISGRIPGHLGPRMRAMRIGAVSGAEEINRRLAHHAPQVLGIYAGLTIILWIALLMAGEHGVTALIHAMGTLSTSGITDGAGMQGAAGLAGEMVIAVFLLLPLSRRLMALPGLPPFPGGLRADPELRLAALLVATVVALLMLRHVVWPGAGLSGPVDFLRALWGAFFTTLSFLTTTGYESVLWASARDWAGMGSPGLVLLGLSIVGGGVATTAGGVTLIRVYALWLHGQRELEHIIHPHAVQGGGWKRRLAREGAWMAWVFFMLFALSLLCVVLLLSMLGLSFERALVMGIAALTTTAPLAESGGSAVYAWSSLGTAAKLVLGVTMVVGRLETLALIALLAPGAWRR